MINTFCFCFIGPAYYELILQLVRVWSLSRLTKWDSLRMHCRSSLLLNLSSWEITYWFAERLLLSKSGLYPAHLTQWWCNQSPVGRCISLMLIDCDGALEMLLLIVCKCANLERVYFCLVFVIFSPQNVQTLCAREAREALGRSDCHEKAFH